LPAQQRKYEQKLETIEKNLPMAMRWATGKSILKNKFLGMLVKYAKECHEVRKGMENQN
jgi:hypothetical protein